MLRGVVVLATWKGGWKLCCNAGFLLMHTSLYSANTDSFDGNGNYSGHEWCMQMHTSLLCAHISGLLHRPGWPYFDLVCIGFSCEVCASLPPLTLSPHSPHLPSSSPPPFFTSPSVCVWCGCVVHCSGVNNPLMLGVSRGGWKTAILVHVLQ